MTASMIVIRTTTNRYSLNVKDTVRIKLVAATQDDLFAQYFRECDNRYKYCNNVRHQIEDKDLAAGYRTWLADVRNYANNRGDMW